MRPEDISDELNDIDPRYIDAAAPRRLRRRSRVTAAVAAVLALAVVGALVTGGLRMNSFAVETAVYPKMNQYSSTSLGYDRYLTSMRERRAYFERARGLDQYLTTAVPALLAGEAGENRLCSPVNVYMALAMLAEITEGETRQQILDLLGSEDAASLRQKANDVWNACYTDDGAVRSIPAASVWLRKDMTYNRDTLKTLADVYYASSFRGEMGSESYDQALRDWIDEQTGGLLRDQTAKLHMDDTTVIDLVATLWFKARWAHRFISDENTQETFHGAAGDRTVTFMHQLEENGVYWWGETFGAVQKGFKTSLGGSMWLILPDEGVTPEDLLRDPAALGFLLGDRDSDSSKSLRIHLNMPKFDVRSEAELSETLQALGVTDCFDGVKADFTPLGASSPVWVSRVSHGVRVTADEEGVEAAAFTEVIGTGAAMPPEDEMDFTLDRPFLFVLESASGLPLFVGIVNNVE